MGELQNTEILSSSIKRKTSFKTVLLISTYIYIIKSLQDNIIHEENLSTLMSLISFPFMLNKSMMI